MLRSYSSILDKIVLKKLAKDKHSSLFCFSAIDEEGNKLERLVLIRILTLVDYLRGLKSLPRTNTLAYFVLKLVTKR